MQPNKSKTLLSFKGVQVEHIKVKNYCKKINLRPCCALEPIVNKYLYAWEATLNLFITRVSFGIIRIARGKKHVRRVQEA
jgi:hypothetical protein